MHNCVHRSFTSAMYLVHTLVLFNNKRYFYYASIRSLSLQHTFLGCFFDICNAIFRCGTMTEQLYFWRKYGEGSRKEHKNFKNHIIGSIITSKDFLSVKIHIYIDPLPLFKSHSTLERFTVYQ